MITLPTANAHTFYENDGKLLSHHHNDQLTKM